MDICGGESVGHVSFDVDGSGGDPWRMHDVNEICACGHRWGNHAVGNPHGCFQECTCTRYLSRPRQISDPAPVVVDDDFDRLFVAREE